MSVGSNIDARMSSLPPPSELVAKLVERGIQLPAGKVVVGGYGDSAELSRELIELIRKGPKRAGTGLLWEYEFESEPIPEAGSIEIVVDHDNEPVLVTRLTSVEIVPFNQVSAQYAATEGEGDGSLEYWRSGHWSFFSRECARIGRVPAEDMPVVCSVFELLFVVPPSAVQPFAGAGAQRQDAQGPVRS